MLFFFPIYFFHIITALDFFSLFGDQEFCFAIFFLLLLHIFMCLFLVKRIDEQHENCICILGYFVAVTYQQQQQRRQTYHSVNNRESWV